MKNLSHIKHVYFLGIGGIGMSALARYFNTQGVSVAGTDRNSSALIKNLEGEGITVIRSAEVEDIPQAIKEDRNTLVVFTPAISRENPQYQYFLSEGYTVKKRAAVLGDISREINTLAVAGTHGKTTTTAILGHLLKTTGAKISAFLGGISENYQSNLILDGTEAMVVEADEFDRSFLHLSPNIACITSMDADHLDIYGELKQLEESFKAFADLLPVDGLLFHKKGLPLNGISVAVDEEAEVRAQNVRIENGRYLFDLNMKGEILTGFTFALPGKHNLFNAVAALAMAIANGSPKKLLPEALGTFKGVSRRFSYKIRTENLVLIDDYAHHPEELRAVHQAVREMHPGKEVLAVFQPHLFSRTRDFANEFGEALSLFDQVRLLDIYPAREEPIEGITADWLLKKINNPNKRLVEMEILSDEIKATGAQVVLLLGAGDIGEEVEKITYALTYES